MLKPSIRSVEGWVIIIVVLNALGAMWYLITKTPPPLPDYEMFLKYADNAIQVGDILKMAAEAQKETSIDWTKLTEMGGIGGFASAAFAYFLRIRSKLKAEDLNKNNLETVLAKIISEVNSNKKEEGK
jgi:hypothetical protein